MDSAATPHDDLPAQRLAALLIARGVTIAVALGGAERWRQLQAYTLAPIELPGGPVPTGASSTAAAEEVASRLLNGQARSLPSKHTYGRTPAHAIDRLDSCPPTELPPLIYLERGLPAEQDSTPSPRRLDVYVFRGAFDGDPVPAPSVSGLLWLPLPALRQAVRGLPLADLCALPGVVWQPTPQVDIPNDLFVYVPAEYGERHLLRVAAKYGSAAVFQNDESQDNP